MTTGVRPILDRRGAAYTPAVGSRLRPLLWVSLGGFALLGANGAYLASVSALTWWLGTTQQTYFYFLMVIVHLVLGFGLIVPFLAFGLAHLATSWRRPNRTAVRYGLMLLASALVVMISGLVLVRLGRFEIRDPATRAVGYWLHVLAPLVVVGLYVKHRLAGPKIHWDWAGRLGLVVGAAVLAMILLHTHDPRSFGVKGPREGKHYFFPSEAVTADGKFIPASTLMMDDYCLKCHQDAYNGWFHSAHHFSSFNNKAYLFSVRETRQVALKRDGDTRAARWCAGCHDPVPFFSGEFDNPEYDDVNTRTSQAGITCTVCHAITNVNSTRGNADYTIEAPQHYPFATSQSALLQWVNNTLVKAKPEMHKKTFLKPVIKGAEFCSTCHKVGLPYALNHYKDFLRGQNHYDTFLLSGVSGRGARSFYYPPQAKGDCVSCHMNLVASRDFGARDFDRRGGTEIHNHLFLGANTGLATIRGRPDVAAIHERFLQDAKVRVDVFALRDGGTIDGPLLGPLRPEVPTLQPSRPYLVEVVVRTLGLGHPFSQGTADSNEIWVELVARHGDRVLGRSGGLSADGAVDPFAHFINIYMLDRDGKRVDRRNPQDIFVPLYNKQIPPGAGQVVHFGLDVPSDTRGPLVLEARVNYRKFDRQYMDHVFGKGQGPALPVVVMASDRVVLPIAGGPAATNAPAPIKETWQRWNDYGIGLLLEGGDRGAQKGELRQAEPIFQKVAELGLADGWVNLARVYIREGRIPEAREALDRAAAHSKPAAPWVINWLAGQINDRNGLLDEAIASYESVLATRVPDRGFDFSGDYEVINALGASLYARARLEPSGDPAREDYLRRAATAYRRTLAIDSESVAAHFGVGLTYAELARSVDLSIVPRPRYERRPSGRLDHMILAQATAAAKVGADPPSRAARALDVAATIPRFLAMPPTRFVSRLDPLHAVVERLGPAFAAETDPTARAALARALAVTHQALHAMFKPDETAEGRAVAIARRASPAADQNAQSIVIHSLHRPGTPGLEASAAAGPKDGDE
jgi:tetratricopeptide (TPR) repeat protein